MERLVAQRNEVLAWSAVLPLVHLDAGDTAAAGDALDAALADVPPGLLWLPAHAWLGEAAARLGRTDACATVYERLSPYSGRLVQSSFTGCWARSTGSSGCSRARWGSGRRPSGGWSTHSSSTGASGRLRWCGAPSASSRRWRPHPTAKSEIASETAHSVGACAAMPQCDVATSSARPAGSTQARQSTTPSVRE